jgi:hypothetical protein
MFTRYVTFIFLLGLSALFFTSGRSASISREAQKDPLYSVTRAERGGLPDSAGPMLLPAAAEATALD